jgi:uncharacterized protein
MRAAEENGVIAPLLEAGLTKEDVRRIAEERGLSVADKPASPCLASRIPVGVEVTAGRLDEVDRAERVLRELGFREFRVRHHGDVARLEVDPAGAILLQDPVVRSKVANGIKQAGFRFVAVDLCDLKSGSLSRQGTHLHRIEPARSSGQ